MQTKSIQINKIFENNNQKLKIKKILKDNNFLISYLFDDEQQENSLLKAISHQFSGKLDNYQNILEACIKYLNHLNKLDKLPFSLIVFRDKDNVKAFIEEPTTEDNQEYLLELVSLIYEVKICIYNCNGENLKTQIINTQYNKTINLLCNDKINYQSLIPYDSQISENQIQEQYQGILATNYLEQYNCKEKEYDQQDLYPDNLQDQIDSLTADTSTYNYPRKKFHKKSFSETNLQNILGNDQQISQSELPLDDTVQPQKLKEEVQKKPTMSYYSLFGNNNISNKDMDFMKVFLSSQSQIQQFRDCPIKKSFDNHKSKMEFAVKPTKDDDLNKSDENIIINQKNFFNNRAESISSSDSELDNKILNPLTPFKQPYNKSPQSQKKDNQQLYQLQQQQQLHIVNNNNNNNNFLQPNFNYNNSNNNINQQNLLQINNIQIPSQNMQYVPNQEIPQFNMFNQPFNKVQQQPQQQQINQIPQIPNINLIKSDQNMNINEYEMQIKNQELLLEQQRQQLQQSKQQLKQQKLFQKQQKEQQQFQKPQNDNSNLDFQTQNLILQTSNLSLQNNFSNNSGISNSNTQLNLNNSNNSSFLQNNNSNNQNNKPVTQNSISSEENKDKDSNNQTSSKITLDKLNSSTSTNNNEKKKKPKKKIKDQKNVPRHYGKMKFFDENKKYGFILNSLDQSDVFVHYDDLQKAGITIEYLNTNKEQGNPSIFTFKMMSYNGKYEKSRKAVDIKLEKNLVSNNFAQQPLNSTQPFNLLQQQTQNQNLLNNNNNIQQQQFNFKNLLNSNNNSHNNSQTVSNNLRFQQQQQCMPPNLLQDQTNFQYNQQQYQQQPRNNQYNSYNLKQNGNQSMYQQHTNYNNQNNNSLQIQDNQQNLQFNQLNLLQFNNAQTSQQNVQINNNQLYYDSQNQGMNIKNQQGQPNPQVQQNQFLEQLNINLKLNNNNK